MEILSSFDLQILSQLALAYATRFGGALLFLFAGWIVAGWAKRAVARRLALVEFDATLGLFFAGAARWLVLVAVVVSAMGIFGIPMTTFAAVIGAASLAIGLSLQGTLSHFASGMLLLIFRPFKVGDVVTAAGITAKVQEIQLFTTVFDTPDNRRIFVPNSLLFGDVIENVTYHPVRRVDVAVGCDYSADIDATRAALERAVERVHKKADEPAPQVVLKDLGASSVDWVVRIWSEQASFWDVREEAIRAVKTELDAAGIGIPFPQLDVHLNGRLERG